MLIKDQVLYNDRNKIDCIGLTINRKSMEYQKYVVEHKYNVKYMWIKYSSIFQELFNLTDKEIDSMDIRIYFHDNTKLSIEEFDGYRIAFYPTKEEYDSLGLVNKENIKDVMNDAWVHHYTYNDHHPEHYYMDKDTDEVKEMPKLAIIEMVCDWLAMAFQNSSKVYIWYESNKDNIILNPKTRATVELCLNAIKKFDISIGEYA